MSPDKAPRVPTFAIFEPDTSRSAKQWLPAIPGRRRLLVVYGVAAGLHALAITTFQLSYQAEVTWISALARWWVNTWPLVPALIALSCSTGGRACAWAASSS